MPMIMTSASFGCWRSSSADLKARNSGLFEVSRMAFRRDSMGSAPAVILNCPWRDMAMLE